MTVKALKKRGLTGEELRCLMWGRESINTPVKVKKPPVDPLLDPNGPNLKGAFGETLTAALDVMAFTHDVDINGASQGLNLANNTKIINQEVKDPMGINKSIINNQMNLINQQITTGVGDSLFGVINQTNDMIPVQKPSIIPTAVFGGNKPINIPAQEWTDPLREIILCTNENDSQKINNLAVQAANLPDVDEVTSKPNTSVKSLAGKLHITLIISYKF